MFSFGVHKDHCRTFLQRCVIGCVDDFFVNVHVVARVIIIICINNNKNQGNKVEKKNLSSLTKQLILGTN